MQMKIGNVMADVDVAATQRFYASAPRLLVPCDCPGCRNFCQAVRHMQKDARALLEQLGIDPENPAEQWGMCAENAGSMLVYNAFWHLCGQLVSPETEPFLPLPQQNQCTYRVSAQCGLVSEDFPRPVLQLDMNLRLPWLLDEQNPY